MADTWVYKLIDPYYEPTIVVRDTVWQHLTVSIMYLICKVFGIARPALAAEVQY